ncbi:MAG: ChaB family protein [Thermoleophilia bacterium]
MQCLTGSTGKHRVAWAAVRHDYRKGDDGKWHRKKAA